MTAAALANRKGCTLNVNRRFTIALLGCQSLALAITPPGQAQVGKVAPAKGGAIHQNPEGQQVKALGHQQQGWGWPAS
jgi:hypothetical protein